MAAKRNKITFRWFRLREVVGKSARVNRSPVRRPAPFGTRDTGGETHGGRQRRANLSPPPASYNETRDSC